MRERERGREREKENWLMQFGGLQSPKTDRLAGWRPGRANAADEVHRPSAGEFSSNKLVFLCYFDSLLIG